MCSGMVQSMVSFAMDAESCFVAVERMMEYLKVSEQLLANYNSCSKLKQTSFGLQWDAGSGS